MTKDELKALGISEEVADKIVEDYGKNYVSKSQFNAKNEELKAAKAEKEAMTKDLDNLRKTNKDNEGLTAQLEEMKKSMKDREAQYKADMDAYRMNAAIDLALTTAKAKNTKAVKSLLDASKLKLNEDGTVIGLDEQVEGLKKSDAYMFGEATKNVDGVHPGNPGGHDEPGEEAGIAKEFGEALGL